MSTKRNNYTNEGSQIHGFIPEITFNLNDGQFIDLFFYDQASQQFELNSDAAELFLQYGGNIGFVFNIGQKSTGKSFLINHLMDLDAGQNAFPEHTRGINIWTKPLFRETEFLYLFFVDVQGFDSDANFHNFAWLLSFLLGTIVLYTSVGALDDQSWSDLASFEFLSQRLIIAENTFENDYSLSYYAPKFIWLLKEFDAPLTDGKVLPAEKYLEGAIFESDRNNSPAANYARQFLLNAFKDRSCVTFPPLNGPVPFTEPLNRLPPAYTESVKLLKEKIYSKGLNKYFDGISLSPRMVIHFFSCIVELFNSQSQVNYYEVLV